LLEELTERGMAWELASEGKASKKRERCLCLKWEKVEAQSHLSQARLVLPLHR
jgi:hypothetical protein